MRSATTTKSISVILFYNSLSLIHQIQLAGTIVVVCVLLPSALILFGLVLRLYEHGSRRLRWHIVDKSNNENRIICILEREINLHA